MTLNNIMQDTVVEKAKNRIVEIKMDNLGLVSADPTFFTDENIKRLNEHKNLVLITFQIRRESQIIDDEVAKEEQDELTRVTDNTVKKYIEKGECLPSFLILLLLHFRIIPKSHSPEHWERVIDIIIVFKHVFHRALALSKSSCLLSATHYCST